MKIAIPVFKFHEKGNEAEERDHHESEPGTAPRVSKGFHIACEDIGAQQAFVLYPGDERYPLGESVDVIGLPELLQLLAEL